MFIDVLLQKVGFLTRWFCFKIEFLNVKIAYFLDTQTFVLRLKAFDTCKNVENALVDCGYLRPIGKKFEEFLIDLVNDDNCKIPKNLFKQLIAYYKWILSDPKVSASCNIKDSQL